MIYLHHREHYNVELKEIQVGDDVLQLPKDFFGVGTNQGTIIDSGTTLAYLPDLAYKQLIKKVYVIFSMFALIFVLFMCNSLG